MTWHPLRWLTDQFGGSSESGRSEQTDAGLTTRLYSCPSCVTTYISEEMESCPECSAEVVQVPAELGQVASR